MTDSWEGVKEFTSKSLVQWTEHIEKMKLEIKSQPEATSIENLQSFKEARQNGGREDLNGRNPHQERAVDYRKNDSHYPSHKQHRPNHHHNNNRPREGDSKYSKPEEWDRHYLKNDDPYLSNSKDNRHFKRRSRERDHRNDRSAKYDRKYEKNDRHYNRHDIYPRKDNY